MTLDTQTAASCQWGWCCTFVVFLAAVFVFVRRINAPELMWINLWSNSSWSELRLRAVSLLWWPTNHSPLDLILWFLPLVAQRFELGFWIKWPLSGLPPAFKQTENISPLQISCRIYPVCSTLWFVMTGVEYYADTVWHCKSTASSLLPLSNGVWRCISAMSPQHWAHWIEE